MITLTPREEEIIEHLLETDPMAVIARKLRISNETLKRHVFHIYDKTGMNSRLELQALYKGKEFEKIQEDLKDALYALRKMCDLYSAGLISVNHCLAQAKTERSENKHNAPNVAGSPSTLV